jgi:hypothetical protein
MIENSEAKRLHTSAAGEARSQERYLDTAKPGRHLNKWLRKAEKDASVLE